jgi:hypothetical protein
VNGESGWWRYGAVLAIAAIIGAGIWWRVTGYRTDVGLAIVGAGLAVLVVGLVASRFSSRRG